MLATIKELCLTRLPGYYADLVPGGLRAVRDIQVLTPVRKGTVGCINLNKELQQVLNPQTYDDFGKPEKEEKTYGEKLFREGDKIMQTKNNYNIEWESEDEKGTGIFNGDIGILEEIDAKSGLVKINFDGRIAELPAEHLADLDLSYAITVHKSQGSEFKAVIIPTMGVVPNLAYRNLLYTAVTRAKDMLITVGSGELIYKMTANDKKAKRYSALSHFLKAEF
jgi:exodeoxyribonuclease V alpha subunit